jgi:hypothetical protein
LKKQNKQAAADAIKKQLDKTIAMDGMKDLPVVFLITST